MFSSATINFEGVRDRGDAVHYEIDPLPIETQGRKSGLEIGPFNPIIGLAHIQFKSCEALFTFGIPKPVHVFETNDDIVHDGSAWDEGTLVWVNYLIHDVFEPIGDRSCDNFVCDIVEADRSEVFHGSRCLNLGHKGNHHGVPLFEGGSNIEYIQNRIGNFSSNDIPRVLKKQSCKTIGTGSFRWIVIKRALRTTSLVKV